MFFDPKPVNPWHSKKENVPGVFYRFPRLVNRAASVSSSFSSGPRLGGSLLLAHIIHDSSWRNRAVALRDGHAEPRGPDAYSCSTVRVRGASPLAAGPS